MVTTACTQGSLTSIWTLVLPTCSPIWSYPSLLVASLFTEDPQLSYLSPHAIAWALTSVCDTARCIYALRALPTNHHASMGYRVAILRIINKLVLIIRPLSFQSSFPLLVTKAMPACVGQKIIGRRKPKGKRKSTITSPGYAKASWSLSSGDLPN